MAATETGYRKVNWDELPNNRKFPRPPGYTHPWPTDEGSDYVSRDLDDALALEHMSVVFVRIGPGQTGTHHRHAQAEELHVLLEGSCQMMVGDEVVEARKHDAIVVEPHVNRSFHNHSDAECWWLVIGAPVDEFRPRGVADYLAANGYPPGFEH